MGDPSDPIKNCLLEVCCGAAAAESAFAKALVRETGVTDDQAKKCASWVFEYFELAPRGSLTQFKAEIARVAKA
jgi:hypothetical protein